MTGQASDDWIDGFGQKRLARDQSLQNLPEA
jgi:hypothetical protein